MGQKFVLHGLSWFSGALKLFPCIKPEGGHISHSQGNIGNVIIHDFHN